MIRYILTSLPMLVCLFWSCQLWVDWYKEGQTAKLRLLIFSSVTMVLYFGHMAYFNQERTIMPYTETLYSMANLSVFPLYYLYLLELTEAEWKRHWQVTLMVPAIIIGVMTGCCYALLDEGEREPVLFIVRMVAKVIFAIQVVMVMAKGYRKVKKFDGMVENYFADTENRTLKNVQGIMILLIMTSVVSFIANLIGKEAFVDSLALVSIPSVVFSILLFVLLMMGHQQTFTIHELMVEATEDATEMATEEAPAEESAEKIHHIARGIERMMREEKPYLLHDLRLSDVARRLNTNRDYVSRAIRMDMGMSFNEYVNKMRIDYAITLMKGNPQLSALEVSVKAGYTSLASFYRNFKQFTGSSPKQFMQG